jgi:hypothetical protein
LLSFIITDEEEKSWRGLQGVMLHLSSLSVEIKKGWRGLPEASALAYWASSTVEMQKKVGTNAPACQASSSLTKKRKVGEACKGQTLWLICPSYQ